MLSISGSSVGSDRARIGWWLFVGVLALAAAYLTYSFIGMVSLGVFGYYATRPIYERIDDRVGSDGAAAWITVGLIIVPVVLLSLYAGFRVLQQAHLFLSSGGTDAAGLVGQFVDVDALTKSQRQSLNALLDDPTKVLSNPQSTLKSALSVGVKATQAVLGGLVLVSLSIALSAFLLMNEEELSDGLVELFGGRDTAVYAYASAVDRDLESVWFGNLLFALVMMVVAAITYWATNVFAPAGLSIPMVWVLALLTGAASLVPIVVGKVVYLPVVGWLGYQAVRSDGGGSLAFVGIVLLVYFLVLDILPQAVVQPYVTGRKLDMMMLLFGYLIGPILFGWYGFFFLPTVFVVMLEAIRIVLPELVHGDRLTPQVSLGEGVGSEPEVGPGTPTGEPVADDGPTTDN
jgi:predicted PurR-regulated permease PerM